MKIEKQEILDRIKPYFGEFFGTEAEEMDLYSEFEEDLAVDLHSDEFKKVVAYINAEFSIHLVPTIVAREVTTVDEFVDLIAEEILLG